MWLKWRHKFADGPDGWDWEDFGDSPSLSADEIADFRYLREFGRFEKRENYRGTECHVVPHPPPDHLRKVIAEHEKSIRNLQSVVNRLKSILKETSK